MHKKFGLFTENNKMLDFLSYFDIIIPFNQNKIKLLCKKYEKIYNKFEFFQIPIEICIRSML